MKVSSVSLSHYKQFEAFHLDFRDELTGLPHDLVLIEGANGSGKTTLLQAIAFVVGKATGRLSASEPLPWTGFDETLAGANWKVPPRIEVSLTFDQEELTAVQSAWDLLKDRREMTTRPSTEPVVDLVYEHGKITAKQGAAALFQCRGRSYARQVFKNHPDGRTLFEKVGYPFWYTEARTHTSFTAEQGHVTFELSDLRNTLSSMTTFHEQLQNGKRQLLPGHRDRFALLQKLYQKVFPERCLVGPSFGESIDQANVAWFNLSDGHYDYDISEMSGAERAIFPILFDFVNWDLHQSIILIDEVELHLHPPIQQRFLRALPRLGRNNQFFLTTHSNHIADFVVPAARYLMGARQ